MLLSSSSSTLDFGNLANMAFLNASAFEELAQPPHYLMIIRIELSKVWNAALQAKQFIIRTPFVYFVEKLYGSLLSSCLEIFYPI